ncbi:MAG: hypothetical protein WAO00_01040, partial [Chthoniobacterales bacterium]
PAILRELRDPDNESAWTTATTPLPADLPGDDTGLYASFLLIRGDTDRLLIFRDNSVQEAPIGADGAVGAISPGVPKELSTLVPADIWRQSRTLTSGARYVLEMLLHDQGGTTFQCTGYVLRDVVDLKTYAVDADAFPADGGGAIEEAPSAPNLIVVPLAGNAPDLFRCVTIGKASGSVQSVTLVRDPASGVFNVKQKVQVGQVPATSASGPSPGYQVHVHEATPGQVVVVMLNLPGLISIGGAYDPTSGGDITWGSPWNAELPNFQVPPQWVSPSNSPMLEGIWNASAGAIEFLLSGMVGRDEIWNFSLQPGSSITEPAPVGLNRTVVNIFPAELPTFLVRNNLSNGWEIWTRNEAGDYDIEALNADSEDAAPSENIGYRVGITLTQDGLPLTGADIGLTASRLAPALSGGRMAVIPTRKPLALQTDENGQVWITLLQESSLSFPKLFVTCPLFENPLELEVDAEIQNYLTKVTDADLAGATDPRTGQSVLKSADSAPDVGKSIRAAMTLIPAAVASSPSAIKVVSSCPYYWRATPVEKLGIRQPISSAGAPSWVLDASDGTPRFRQLEHAEAAAIIAELCAAHPSVLTAKRPSGIQPMGFFDDFTDWVGDMASLVWDSLVQVSKVVVDGVNITVKLFIDGAHFVYNGVLDTIERVLDAVAFVLNAAGEALGTAVGWLLEQLGFLFDWKALKQKRDELRDAVRSGLALVTQQLPDPAILASSFGATLDGAKNDVITALNNLRSTPLGEQSFGSITGSVPSLSSMLMMGDSTIMPQATWLLDKVTGALERLFPLPPMPVIAGLDLAMTTYGSVATTVSNGMATTLAGLTNLVDSWIQNATLFSSSSLDALIDILTGLVSALFDIIKAIVTAAGDVMHLLWASPTAIVDWLDSPLQIPFFSGFYKGLTGNKFSLFDAMCLSAAVIATSLGSVTGHRAAAMADESGGDLSWRGNMETFMFLGCFTETISAFNNAAAPNATMLSSVLNLVPTVGAIACGMPGLGAPGSPDMLEAVIVSSVLGAVAVVLAVSPAARGAAKNAAGDVALVGTHIYQSVKILSASGGAAGAFDALGLVKTTAAGGLRLYVLAKGAVDPKLALVYAALQGTLSSAQLGLTIAQN